MVDTQEMERITRRRNTSQREKKLSMMTKLRSLWDLCTTEEALCTTQETREVLCGEAFHKNPPPRCLILLCTRAGSERVPCLGHIRAQS